MHAYLHIYNNIYIYTCLQYVYTMHRYSVDLLPISELKLCSAMLLCLNTIRYNPEIEKMTPPLKPITSHEICQSRQIPLIPSECPLNPYQFPMKSHEIHHQIHQISMNIPMKSPLVGGISTPLNKIFVRQLDVLFQTEWKKTCSKPPTRYLYLYKSK